MASMTERSGEELREHPRFRVALRVHLATRRGTVSAVTVSVSRRGMGVRLDPPPGIGEELPVTLELPNGTSVDGRAQVKSHLPGSVCGMALSFTGDAHGSWSQFVDEEESTGSLWRMIGRMARAPDDELAPRGLRETRGTEELRFHTAGENGEAYRVAFEKHAADVAERSDLARTLPGFRELAPAIARVLREPMSLRMDEGGKLLSVRVAELQRGGYAWVQGAVPGEAAPAASLVSLGVGELVLVARNDRSVFPHFDDDDLERIACDTFRRDLPRAVFTKSETKVVDAEPQKAARPAPVTLPPLPASKMPARFQQGLDAVRFAQAAADDVQVRRYGDRDIYFHPSVWARVKDAGSELMGPTIHDGVRVCVLALVGPGSPKVVRLDEGSDVSLLKPPAR